MAIDQEYDRDGAKTGLKLTSGCPLGSKNSSGTDFLILVSLPSDGGDGFELYSVRDKPLRLGVL
jgi:hypothetical protein